MADRNKELYMAELEGISHCSEDEMKELIPMAAGGDETAFNRLAEGNLYRTYEAASYFSGPHVRFMDLVGEGNLALLGKLREFKEYHEGVGAEMDAAIREAMEAYKAQENEAYRAGVELKTRLNVIDQVCVRIADEKGREATAEEVAEAMKMDVDDVKYLMRIALTAIKKED